MTSKDGSMHRLPKQLNRRKMWVTEILKVQEKIALTAVICSAHLSATDYHPHSDMFFTKRPLLKSSAVPYFETVSMSVL
jgi:hypothetical protein